MLMAWGLEMPGLPWHLGLQVDHHTPKMMAPPETQFPSLGQEDPLEEGMVTHSSILRGAWRATVHGVAKSQTGLKRLAVRARRAD